MLFELELLFPEWLEENRGEGDDDGEEGFDENEVDSESWE